MRLFRLANLSVLALGAVFISADIGHAESAKDSRYNPSRQKKSSGGASIFGGIGNNLPNPFEGIFGTSRTSRPKKRKPLQPVTNNDGFGDIDYTGPNTSVALSNPEPYQAAEYYDYVAEGMVRLVDKRLQQPGGELLDDSLAQTVFSTLNQGGAVIFLTRKQRDALIKFYKSRDFKPMWTSLDGVSERATEVLAYMSKADQEGLKPEEYLPSVLNSYGAGLDGIESDISKLAQFELAMSAMALRYAMHASGGRIAPNRLSGYHDLKPPTVNPGTALAAFAKQSNPAGYLAGLHPTSDIYKSLRTAMAKELGKTNEPKFEPIAAGGLIRPGDQDSRIPAVRKRMRALGLLKKAPVIEASTEISGVNLVSDIDQPTSSAVTDDAAKRENFLYDNDLVAAVKIYQRNSNLAPDGVIGGNTFAAFNGRKTFNHRQKLALNMERARWLPRNLGNRYVIVNQASFSLRVMDAGQEVWQTKVIIGKSRNQTSFFSDQMETVVFNPYWGVPHSILKHEMLAKLRKSRSYLDRNGYEVHDRRGRKISSSSVNWSQYGYDSKIPYDVRQLPGPKNALGEVKFLFPNKHAIYLHDTPSRSLFKRQNRALSHGCVRVENPQKLARVILGWNQSKISEYIAARKNRAIKLKSTTPVHLVYFTAWPDDNGKISYFSDVYTRDKHLTKALGTVNLAMR